jgi:hypothetical protein
MAHDSPLPAALRRPLYHPLEVPTAAIETVTLDEVLGRVALVDLVAALAGERGAVVRLGCEPA